MKKVVRRFAASLAVPALLIGACSSEQGSSLDAVARDAAAEGASTSPSDAAALGCSGDASPNLAACSTANAVCAASGYDCCICRPTHGCSAPLVWACHTNPAACPATPPDVGTPCTLSGDGCTWCAGGPALWLGCTNGTWQPLGDLYCTDAE